MTRAAPFLLLLALSGVAACGGDTPAGALCAPGTQRCAENTYQQCADDGASWVDVRACGDTGEVCVTDVGCRDCFPDFRTCDGIDMLRCRPDGTGFDLERLKGLLDSAGCGRLRALLQDRTEALEVVSRG